MRSYEFLKLQFLTMTFRQSNTSCNDKYSKPKSRLNQQIRCDSIDEGCPVMEESGAVCGETDNFDVFQEFRKIYEDCIAKLKGTEDGNATLRKLAPFKKLIDDLWEQNTMLVETVEELEQEATCRVTNLQDKLNKSCQKMYEFEEDIRSLVDIIQSLCKDGVYNPAGLKLNTICPASVFGACKKSCFNENQRNETEFDTCMEDCSGLKNLKLYDISEEPEKKCATGYDVFETGSVPSFLSDCSPNNVEDVTDFAGDNFLNENCSLDSFDQKCEPDNDCHCQKCVQQISVQCNIKKCSFNIKNEDNSECYCRSLHTVPELDEH